MLLLPLLPLYSPQTKAKAIRKYVDKMIGLAKEGTLHARRQALGFIYDPELVKSLFEQVCKDPDGLELFGWSSCV